MSDDRRLITKEGIISLGYKFALEDKNGNDVTFYRESLIPDHRITLVWHPTLSKVIFSHCNWPPPIYHIKQLYIGEAITIGEIEFLDRMLTIKV